MPHDRHRKPIGIFLLRSIAHLTNGEVGVSAELEHRSVASGDHRRPRFGAII